MHEGLDFLPIIGCSASFTRQSDCITTTFQPQHCFVGREDVDPRPFEMFTGQRTIPTDLCHFIGCDYMLMPSFIASRYGIMNGLDHLTDYRPWAFLVFFFFLKRCKQRLLAQRRL